MDRQVIRQFDANADEYDRQRKQLVPCFDDFYGTAVSLVDSRNPAPKILDLGAGTGLFSDMVLRKYPNAEITLVDLSERMLEQARRRFANRPDVRFIAADYAEYDFAEPYCFVISSLSIHHLAHPDKRRLFSKIHRLLKPGGAFVNADQAQGSTARTDAYFMDRWLADVRGSGLSEEALQASVERRKLDINATLREQLAWMEQAGFSDVDCMYKNMGFAVFFGRK